MSWADRINTAIDDRKEEIVDFAFRLVKQLSETPPGNETNVAEVIQAQAKHWGLPAAEVIEVKENRPNLIFTLGGRGAGPSLVLNGHTDTKPIGDATQWSVVDPYSPSIVDGKLYGRGSTDMKGAVAAMLASAMAVHQSGADFSGKLILALTADEEGGSAFGAKALIDHGFQADSMIIAEPSGIETDFDSIGIACRGAVLGKVVVRGTQMHSSLSEQKGCINASVEMARVLVEFAENLKKHLDYKYHPLYPNGPTINPGVMVNGGVYYGVVPGVASFNFDLRVIPGMSLEGIQRDINEFLRQLSHKNTELHAELVLEKEPNNWAPPVEISSGHSLVKACTEATREVLGFAPRLVGAPFGTDGVFFVKAGLKMDIIPSFGPGLIKLAHGPDEYIHVQSIIDAAKIFAFASLNYLGSGGLA